MWIYYVSAHIKDERCWFSQRRSGVFSLYTCRVIEERWSSYPAAIRLLQHYHDDRTHLCRMKRAFLKFPLEVGRKTALRRLFPNFGELQGHCESKQEPHMNIYFMWVIPWRRSSEMIYQDLIPCFPLSSGVLVWIPVTGWSWRVGSVCARVSFPAFLSGNVGVCWSSIMSASSFMIWVKSWKLLQRLEKKNSLFLVSATLLDVASLRSASSPVDDVISFHACWLAESPDPAQHVLLSFSAHDIRTHPLMDNLRSHETHIIQRTHARNKQTNISNIYIYLSRTSPHLLCPVAQKGHNKKNFFFFSPWMHICGFCILEGNSTESYSWGEEYYPKQTPLCCLEKNRFISLCRNHLIIYMHDQCHLLPL